jgi:spermidine/putrescine transport system substrate-binding protein
MKMPFLSALTIVVALLLSACNGNGKKDQLGTELNVYNWTNVIPMDVIKGFEKQFNVQVNYNNYSSNEELLAKLQAAPGSYDVVFPSDYMVDIMRKQHLLEPVRWSNVPNLKNIDPQFMHAFYDPDNTYSVPFQWSTVGLGINTAKIKVNDPSWDMLFNPKYKGRITMLDDIRYGMAPALIKLGFDVNTKNPDQLAEAKALMISQKPLVKAYSSDTYIDLLKSGEVDIVYGYSIDLLQAARNNKNIAYFIPKEGATKGVESMVIPKNAKHSRLAEAFINYILDARTHARISNYSLATNPNKAALAYIPDSIKNNKNIFPNVAQLQKLIYLHDVGKATTIYDQIWNEIKAH